MAMSNLHKAAIVLLSLPKKQVVELLSRLEPQQAAAVGAEMNALGDVNALEQEAVVREFAQTGFSRRSERQAAKTAPFQFLHNLPSDSLLDAIADEHPQTIALILSYLPPQQAAALVAELGPDEQLSVICRMATMNETEPGVVRDVEMALKRRISGTKSEPVGNRGVASVVQMLNVMDPSAERRLFDRLTATDPQLVREIRRVMFGSDVADAEQWGVVEAAG